jgi:hypothetical protein
LHGDKVTEAARSVQHPLRFVFLASRRV